MVELRPRANIAAGEAEHSLGAVLAERLPGHRERRPRRERPPTPPTVLDARRRRTRDRACATRTATAGCASAQPSGCAPDAVVVEIGAAASGGPAGARLRSRRTAAAASATRCWPSACSSRRGARRDRRRLELELREQPEALARLLERQARERRASSARSSAATTSSYILIASRGSSSNAARYAQYLLGRANRVPVAFATPSLYTLYEQPPRLDGALVIGISQSGESPDVRAVIDEARRQGRPTIAITNRPTRRSAAAAEAVLPLEAGDELAVAATKTYLNSLGAVALLFASATGDEGALRELRADAGAGSPPRSSSRSRTPPRSTSSPASAAAPSSRAASTTARRSRSRSRSASCRGSSSRRGRRPT